MHTLTIHAHDKEGSKKTGRNQREVELNVQKLGKMEDKNLPGGQMDPGHT